jgi:chaperonin GroES
MKLTERPKSEHIILDATVAERESGQALVISVGTGYTSPAGERIPLDVKPGDVVILKPYVGAPWSCRGVDYHIIEAGDVLAVNPGGRDECP